MTLAGYKTIKKSKETGKSVTAGVAEGSLCMMTSLKMVRDIHVVCINLNTKLEHRQTTAAAVNNSKFPRLPYKIATLFKSLS